MLLSSQKRILVACNSGTIPLFSEFMRVFRQVRVEERLSSALTALSQVRPEAIAAEITFPDGDVWSLVAAVRTGKLCRADVPIVVLTLGEETLAVEKMARDRGVFLFREAALDGLAEFMTKVFDGPRGHSRDNGEKPTALVIDDDPGFLKEIQHLLSPAFRTEGRLTGRAGLEAWRHGFHDLILLDLELPDMHGTEVLRAVLSTSPDQPVLILTSHLSDQNVLRSSLKGARHFAEKTLIFTAPDEILRRCREAMGWRDLYQMDDRERQYLEYLKITRAAGEWLSRGNTQAARVLLARAAKLIQACPEAERGTVPEDDDFSF